MSKNSNSLNEALKKREAEERERAKNAAPGEVIALDDTRRVKVLSPGRLVAKRFFRNKLALVGLGILIFMFVFAFVCPLFYPYSQTQIFYKYSDINVNYASANERTDSIIYNVGDGFNVHYSVENRLNSYIKELESSGADEKDVEDTDGNLYILKKIADKVYSLSASESIGVAEYVSTATVASFNKLGGSVKYNFGDMGEEFSAAIVSAVNSGKESFTFDGAKYTVKRTKKNNYDIISTEASISYLGNDMGAEFKNAVASCVDAGEKTFTFDGTVYRVANSGAVWNVTTDGDQKVVAVASPYVFDTYVTGMNLSENFKAEALIALAGNGQFEDEGENYTIANENGAVIIRDSAKAEFAELNNYAVRRFSGQDTLDFDFKVKVCEVIEEMSANNRQSADFVFKLPAMDEETNYIYDEDGNLTYTDTELHINKTATQYIITCEQTTYLIDIHARPSAQHIFGTDGDGMDILARAMYGGRISLMVGFVVVLIEVFLGVIMGGVAGFFGGWVDTLIMRLVDIFYCIPSMPILIITGALFDAMKMNAYVRLIWMMAILGFLGWAGVARLVRGQILSLREQEFMIAEEATGMRAGKRIFRHLIPNVMPQLIVTATMGLGSVIITESTLSFLGLGVKHPLATWGNMINSVTGSTEDMLRYTYIWIPIGIAICLTVIAFNFVGDGLRDAFDPKMKQ